MIPSVLHNIDQAMQKTGKECEIRVGLGKIIVCLSFFRRGINTAAFTIKESFRIGNHNNYFLSNGTMANNFIIFARRKTFIISNQSNAIKSTAHIPDHLIAIILIIPNGDGSILR